MAATHDRPLIPFLVACTGIGVFSLMDAAMKRLALGMGAYDAVLWRNVAGSLIGALLFLGTRQRWPQRAVLRLHLWRCIVIAPMAFLFFWSLTVLPLAEAIALSFIAPVIAMVLAALLLGERIGRSAILASALGLAGVAVIVGGRLSGSYAPAALWGAGAVLLSATLFAYNLILARRQAQRAGPIEIAFFSALLVAALFAIPAPWLAHGPRVADMPLLAGAAGLAFVSVLLLSWAYARAEAQVLIPVEYTAFVWAALFGWLFFREPVAPPTIAGTLLIVAGSAIAARARPARRGEEIGG